MGALRALPWLAAGCVLAAAAPGAAGAVPRGVLYEGATANGGSVAFGTSADGRRVTSFRASVPGSCPPDPQPTSLFVEAGPVSVARGGRRRGSFRERLVDSVGHDVSGRFGRDGSVAGSVGYFDRGGCTAGSRYRARPLPRALAPRLRLFPLGGGGPVKRASDGAPATDAEMLAGGLAQLPDGSLLVAGTDTNRVWRITPRGTSVVAAGTGASGSSGDGGPATAARLDRPADVAAFPDGSWIVAELGANCVRRVGTDGRISTVAGVCGAPGGFGGDGGPATAARLNYVEGVDTRPDGGFLVADGSNRRVRQVSPGGVITTVAGNGDAADTGDGGPATSAGFFQPSDVSGTTDGGFLVVDGSPAVRRVSAAGIVSTVAGRIGVPGVGGDGGPATAALLSFPSGVQARPGGGFVIVDADAGRLRQVDAAGRITTLAGGGAGVGGVFDALARPYRAAALRSGAIAISSARGAVTIARPPPGRLLATFVSPISTDGPGSSAYFVGSRRRRPALRVRTTLAARVVLSVRRRGRRSAVLARRVRAGTTSIRLRRPLPRGAYRLRLSARAAGRTVTDFGVLSVR